jgi:hypothetical protein
VKNALIFGLLFCLVTLNLPKSFFHAHEHQDTSIQKSGEFSFSADDVDCFVCDIDLTNITFSKLITFHFDPKALVHGKELAYFHEASDFFDQHQLRGPPAIV